MRARFGWRPRRCPASDRATRALLQAVIGLAFASSAQAAVVEFFNPDLDDYFITADPTEQAFVDSGAVGRWQRTGNTFAPGGPDQVCRFYGNANINPATGKIYGPNSHFYTANPAECAGLKASYSSAAKSWKFESNDFLTTPAVNGTCPVGLVPVYRAYNNGFAKGIDSNHRITSNHFAYLQTVAAGSIGEGIVMCAPVDLRGIYVGGNSIIHENPTSLAAALNVPGVDGFLLNIGWNDIEPALGHFDWTILDQWTITAASAGRKIAISVSAGANTPSWLFQPAPAGSGARPLSFSISRKGGLTATCEQETIAAPWDPAFLTQWDAMLAALSAHLKSTGTYDAVVLVRLTGINRDTDELHLPTETAQSTGLDCVSNAITTWQQAGYRPSLLQQGWDAITGSFQKSFPDKSFSVAIIARTNTPFPPIAEDGSIMSGAIPDLSGPPLTLASQKFPGHLVIQNNSLYPTVPAQPATIQFAQTLGTMIAFQTNEDAGPSNDKTATCGTSFTQTAPCTEATYLALLQTGIYPLGQSNGLRAQYIEIFAADAIAFGAAVLQAHNELAP